MAELLTLGQGDSTQVQSGTPDPAPIPPVATPAPQPAVVDSSQEEKKDPPEAVKEGGAEEVDPAKAAILAKDGVHTIPFERLEEARTRARTAEEQAAASAAEVELLRQENERLKQAAPTPSPSPAPAATPTPPSSEVDPARLIEEAGVDFGDYSDTAIAKAVVQLADARVKQQVDAIRKELLPAEESPEVKATRAHYTTIYAAHADADSIAQSNEFAAWRDTQPAYAQKAINDTLAKGSAADVVGIFSAYKQATGKTGATTADPAAVAAAAAAAIEAAKVKPPGSLSDLPAGGAVHHDENEAMLNRSSAQLMQQFEAMNDPKAIMDRLSKAL